MIFCICSIWQIVILNEVKNRKDFEYLIVNIREPFLLALLSLLIKQLKKRNVCFIFVIANGGCRQAVKASDCGSDIRGFDSHHPPHKKPSDFSYGAFYFAEILEMRTHHKAKLCFRVRARVSRGWKKEMMNFLFERRLLRTSKTFPSPAHLEIPLRSLLSFVLLRLSSLRTRLPDFIRPEFRH